MFSVRIDVTIEGKVIHSVVSSQPAITEPGNDVPLEAENELRVKTVEGVTALIDSLQKLEATREFMMFCLWLSAAEEQRKTLDNLANMLRESDGAITMTETPNATIISIDVEKLRKSARNTGDDADEDDDDVPQEFKDFFDDKKGGKS